MQPLAAANLQRDYRIPLQSSPKLLFEVYTTQVCWDLLSPYLYKLCPLPPNDTSSWLRSRRAHNASPKKCMPSMRMKC